MKIKTLLDYEVILANTAQPVCFAIRFDAPDLSQPRPQPAAFCVVLDRSGSMSGKPLELAKAAARVAVRNLRPQDLFGLVVFDDVSQVIVPLQNAINKAEFLRGLEGIAPGGSTNLAGGWALGRDELKKAPGGCSRRLLLLSDGQLNMGIIEPGAVRQIVAAGLESSAIRTSCLGFGEEYNEDLMAMLAQATGGQFYDADSPEKFPGIFESELQGLQKLAVQNLRVRVKRLEFCETVEAFGSYPSIPLPEGVVEYAVGDLVSAETRVLCFQLGVLPLPLLNGQPVASLAGERLLQVEVLWDELGENQMASRSFSQVIRVQATQDPKEIRVQSEVVPWVAMQKAGVAIEAVTQHMDSGNVEAATALLKATIQALKAYGQASQVSEAIQQLTSLLKFIEQGAFDARQRKLSRYRGHSYRKMSSSEFWSASAPAPEFKSRPPEPPPGRPPEQS